MSDLVLGNVGRRHRGETVHVLLVIFLLTGTDTGTGTLSIIYWYWRENCTHTAFNLSAHWLSLASTGL